MRPPDVLPQESIWCAVPVYNNRDTVRRVAEECRAILRNVVVVDDGSTDADVEALLFGLDVIVLKHEKNLGKGRAILTASRYVEDHAGIYMITIDADGQHIPRDMLKFFPLMRSNDPSLIIGCRNFNTENVPASSRFGRSFANFWLMVETGQVISDCQSGFRAYPVRELNQLRFRGSHYDFEAEVLARAAWVGIHLKTVDIDVIYPEPGKRISNFMPFLDNFRLTHRHAMLVSRRLLPVPHKKLVKPEKSIYGSFWRHPGKVLKMLLLESATPQGLALSAAVGLFLGVLPILFMHSIVILYVSMRFNLNKFVALNVQHLAVPPFLPAICIEVGYYMRHGQWLTDLSYKTVFEQFSSRILEWFLGSLVIAPIAATIMAAVMYVTALGIKKVWCIHASSKEGS